MKSDEIFSNCIAPDESALIIVLDSEGHATSDANPKTSDEASALIYIALLTIRNTATTNNDHALATRISQIIAQFFPELEVENLESKSTPLGTFQ